MTDPEIIAGFRNVPGVLRKALLGMTHEQLMARPVPGRWSTHEVAIHVADADAALIYRFKRIVAEDGPTFASWSENDFIARLAYDRQSAEDAVQQIEIGHRQLARIFDHLPAGWLERTGMQTGVGMTTARDVLAKAVWHLSHHLKFVEEKKASLGL